jgi:hypothetical protein
LIEYTIKKKNFDRLKIFLNLLELILYNMKKTFLMITAVALLAACGGKSDAEKALEEGAAAVGTATEMANEAVENAAGAGADMSDATDAAEAITDAAEEAAEKMKEVAGDVDMDKAMESYDKALDASKAAMEAMKGLQ